MRNFLAFIGAAVVVFFGVGLYLGWYNIYRTPSSQPGHSKLEVDINKDKIGKDLKDGAAKAKEAIDRATSNPNEPAPTTSSSAPAKSTAPSKTGVIGAIIENDGWFGSDSRKK